ncbi:hypothetical protein CC2G_006610 [Coprinopsis cinerea AmutBmut pab1-1]|nr:hypothetical protein CC2G_006610 [Coprinopsis cinerea AmutBmut pab1-1]
MSASHDDVENILLQRADYSIQVASIVILYYDYILTLPDEITYIWTLSRKTTTTLYAFCRYALIANLLHFLYKTPGVDGMRLYGDYEPVRSMLGIESLPEYWEDWDWPPSPYESQTKHLVVAPVLVNQHYTLIGIAIAVLMLLFELLAFILAAVRVWKTARQDRRFWQQPHTSINYVILSQGILYIAAVLALSILTAIFNLKVWGGYGRPLNSLKLPLSGLLTARFLLKLRLWERHSQLTTTDWSTSISFQVNTVQAEYQGASQGQIPTMQSSVPSNDPDVKTHSRIGIFEEFGSDIGPPLSVDGQDHRSYGRVSSQRRLNRRRRGSTSLDEGWELGRLFDSHPCMGLDVLLSADSMLFSQRNCHVY